ncbi:MULTISPECIES: lysozyme inhibitor LprI family protein [Pseudoalteromonas]|uniref:lysozyme inhibitor LprI family protein n=1 Tax=Pseudoalteromonas TaxID=53246 RepID=UPI000FFF57F0|nr:MULTISPECIES: lysozyme inhibitor LprI family protein [Pseudoalteromonas]MCG9760323.1 DUF1311 domain-containing protein [Pseudoalteromonas sp. Isolate6]NKC21352.1 DUF1311 domain-containing protein [Pseudoalteromonas galatheae]RXE85893.1 DUF1311 domain-containing protein [Pseudoalteromonas sp. A757]
MRLIAAALFLLNYQIALAGGDVCENPISTIDINECAMSELNARTETLERYYQKSLEHNAFDEQLVEAIKASQLAWQSYLDAHCGAVYTQWREGTIRGVMALECRKELVKTRTHTLWANFLTYMDSTPPVLPEPQ